MRAMIACLLSCFLTVSAASAAGAPTTLHNDDTCDIALLPAATLLLPYFEVDLSAETRTTIFTITNTWNLPEVARVTLWTEGAYPVMTFNIFLTGYDVQSINLYDVLARGRIAPDRGTGFAVSNVGELSGDVVNDIVFDNPVLDERSCNDIPVQVPQGSLDRVLQALTIGRVTAANGRACDYAGGVHPGRAVGYATIDVVGSCTSTMPGEPAYFRDDIRWDNVLIGDYQHIESGSQRAHGGPLVHIRAIPEGGTPNARVGPNFKVNFNQTFYSRYQAGGVRDARQPLPSLFAVRWISGGPSRYRTELTIWRGTAAIPSMSCDQFVRNASPRDTEQVRFDESENLETLSPDVVVDGFVGPIPRFPATSRRDIEDETSFARPTMNAVAGWMYMNLDEWSTRAYLSPLQAWVVVSMFAEDGHDVDFDAAALGNGCSRDTSFSEAVGGYRPIGPAPNFNYIIPRP